MDLLGVEPRSCPIPIRNWYGTGPNCICTSWTIHSRRGIGPSDAAGYHGKDEETRQVFRFQSLGWCKYLVDQQLQVGFI